jgi:hypothetical protein
MSKDHKVTEKRSRRKGYIKRKKKLLTERLKLIKVNKPKDEISGTVSEGSTSE